MRKLAAVFLSLVVLLALSGCEQLSSFFTTPPNNSGSQGVSQGKFAESPALLPGNSAGVSSGQVSGEAGGEMRAVWITQFELSPIRSDVEGTFRTSFAAMMKKCADFGLNTVFVQVRPNGDAFYPSSVYPWSAYVSGTAGRALSYDPLMVMVEEAHKLGLKFHAWVNPYRLQTEKQMQQVSTDYQTRKWYDERSSSDRVVVLDGTCYLNPGYEETRGVIISGVKEIVEKYEVDGIHIDDYFYPTTAETFDTVAAAANAGGKPLNEFRFDNVNQTVKGIYDAIKGVKQGVAFGVSPAGNMANNESKLYADIKKWSSEPGYLDYIIPQIYWNYDHPTMPFAQTLQNWNGIVTAPGVKLIPGLAAYKLDRESWTGAGSVLAKMVVDSRTQPSYGGFAFYSYASMFDSGTEIMQSERTALAEILTKPK